MKFTHHPRSVTDECVKDWAFDPARTYQQQTDPRGIGMWKPRGFWLSVDDDWRRFCEDSEWNLPLTNPIEFKVARDRVLVLSDTQMIRDFSAKYAITADRDPDYHRAVDWPRLSGEYAGIVIAPYCWELRLDSMVSWYYTWDCASACIWDLSAIHPVLTLEDA